MFRQMCASEKNREKIMTERVPRVEFVGEDDINHFRQKSSSAKFNRDGSPVNRKKYHSGTLQGNSKYHLEEKMRTPVKNRNPVQLHLPVQQSTRAASHSPNVRGRVPNRGQLQLKVREKRRTYSHSPNVVKNLGMSYHTQNGLQIQQRKTRAVSLSPNVRPQESSPNSKVKGFSLSPNVKRFPKSANQGQRHFPERNLKVSLYNQHMQGSSSAQKMRNFPRQNQGLYRKRSGSTPFPSSRSGSPNIIDPLDAELGAIPLTPELKLKLKLDQLLVKPIVTMKGTAYNEEKWYERDFDTERNFYSSCTDFLQIVNLTKAQDTAKKLTDFLCSDIIKPRYLPSKHRFRNRKLNHFHTFWNVMHQLPYYTKKWDKKTKAQLIWFFDVGIKETLPCPYCQKHYKKWLVDTPVSAAIGSRRKLNQWLFELHDDVNQRSNKPSFQWKAYERRWAPKGRRNKTVNRFALNDERKQNDAVNLVMRKTLPNTFHQNPELRRVDVAPMSYNTGQLYMRPRGATGGI